ncbi:hypothetical protein B5M47_03450 [candidate division CPR3 bacterium 4484_211]|uniref:Uncharacterized protein n=1 Tax=candidate division CPR3 bacterium 4484_211 TaxID=1968527 RepID=A0A1W9NX08_UNCC3|nr:MAG: hypothetical protein B5M47_03450 [candidate division CPR3 bacterium 4484_211]
MTIIQMDEKIDHGPILAQQKIKIAPTDTLEQLLIKLFSIGGNLLIKLLPLWKNYQDLGAKAVQKELPALYRKWHAKNGKLFLPPKPQDHTQATHTKKFTREDGRINWRKSDEEIDRLVKALTPWPGAWCLLGEITRAQIPNSKLRTSNLKDKRVKILQTHLDKQGKLVVDRVQVEGKKTINWEEFKAGYLKRQSNKHAKPKD